MALSTQQFSAVYKAGALFHLSL